MTPFEAIRGVPNACQVLPTVVTGGQPTPEHLDALAKSGNAIVIDLRESMEPRGFDEPALVKQLGMEYKLVPVGAHTMSDTTLETLRTALTAAGERPVFIHCGSGNRVLRPSRATSRYDSHDSNCHASTTCSHSVKRK